MNKRKNSHQIIAESLINKYIQTNLSSSKNRSIRRLYKIGNCIETAEHFTKWLKFSNVMNVEGIKQTLQVINKVLMWHESKMREKGFTNEYFEQYLKQVNSGLTPIRYRYFLLGVNFSLRVNDLSVICLFHGCNLIDVLCSINPEVDSRLKALKSDRIV